MKKTLILSIITGSILLTGCASKESNQRMCQITCEHRVKPLDIFYIDMKKNPNEELQQIIKNLKNLNEKTKTNILEEIKEPKSKIEVIEETNKKEITQKEPIKEEIKEEIKEPKSKIEVMKKTNKKEITQKEPIKEEIKEEIKEPKSKIEVMEKTNKKEMNYKNKTKEELLKEVGKNQTKQMNDNNIIIGFNKIGELDEETKENLKKEVDKIINGILSMKKVDVQINVSSVDTPISDLKVKKVIDYFLIETPLLEDEIKLNHTKIQNEKDFKIEVKKRK